MRGSLAARGLLTLTVCLAIGTLAAGAVTRARPRSPGEGPSRPSHAVTVSLCSGTTPDRMSHLEVTRSHPTNPEHFTFPAVVESSRASRVRALATMVCRLPRVTGVYHCPVDWSPSYTLHFSLPDASSGTRVRVVHYEPTGCSWVTGAGPSRWSTPAFVTALGAALGLPHATTASFTGTLTRG